MSDEKNGAGEPALVLEGGGFRGMFTAGVLDVLQERGIYGFSSIWGVSAGAVNAANFRSRQIGRTMRDILAFRDDRAVSCRCGRSPTTGDMAGADFMYDEVQNRLDPCDVETFNASEDAHVGRCLRRDVRRAGIPVRPPLSRGHRPRACLRLASHGVAHRGARRPPLPRRRHHGLDSLCGGAGSSGRPPRCRGGLRPIVRSWCSRRTAASCASRRGRASRSRCDRTAMTATRIISRRCARAPSATTSSGRDSGSSSARVAAWSVAPEEPVAVGSSTRDGETLLSLYVAGAAPGARADCGDRGVCRLGALLGPGGGPGTGALVRAAL